MNIPIILTQVLRTTMAVLSAIWLLAAPVLAQTAPDVVDTLSYEGLHKAAWEGDVATIQRLLKAGADLDATDFAGRTALHIAAYGSHEEAVEALIEAGADPDALESEHYDIVTIAAVANDVAMLRLVLMLGARPGNITSIYQGNALIAAAHLGHAEIVEVLAQAMAPLDHVNNLGWTALLEAVILGDGGWAHQETVRNLLTAGANRDIADNGGMTPLDHARQRDFTEMIKILK